MKDMDPKINFDQLDELYNSTKAVFLIPDIRLDLFRKASFVKKLFCQKPVLSNAESRNFGIFLTKEAFGKRGF